MRFTIRKPTLASYRPRITNLESPITNHSHAKAAMAFHAWLSEHDDRLRLQATISTQKQALDAADVREHDRAATLKDTLALIEALKRQTQTPAQVLRDLAKFLSLPQPITLNPPQSGSPATQQGTARSKTAPCVAKKGCPSPVPPSSSASSPAETSPGLESPALAAPRNQQDLPEAPSAQIPAADLKPLFDYVQDCRSCQAQLAAAKQNATDNATKLTAITRERDAAVVTAKRGTFWQRYALWFVACAGAGAVALCLGPLPLNAAVQTSCHASRSCHSKGAANPSTTLSERSQAGLRPPPPQPYLTSGNGYYVVYPWVN